MTTLENTRMDTLRHEWSKLARYRFLALNTKEAWNSLYFHKVGKHSHMTSVQLDNYKKRDDNSVINRWHFFSRITSPTSTLHLHMPTLQPTRHIIQLTDAREIFSHEINKTQTWLSCRCVRSSLSFSWKTPAIAWSRAGGAQGCLRYRTRSRKGVPM
jgi:hypothetical protein